MPLCTRPAAFSTPLVSRGPKDRILLACVDQDDLVATLACSRVLYVPTKLRRLAMRKRFEKPCAHDRHHVCTTLHFSPFFTVQQIRESLPTRLSTDIVQHLCIFYRRCTSNLFSYANRWVHHGLDLHVCRHQKPMARSCEHGLLDVTLCHLLALIPSSVASVDLLAFVTPRTRLRERQAAAFALRSVLHRLDPPAPHRQVPVQQSA